MRGLIEVCLKSRTAFIRKIFAKPGIHQSSCRAAREKSIRKLSSDLLNDARINVFNLCCSQQAFMQKSYTRL
jgi:hypothetical protein